MLLINYYVVLRIYWKWFIGIFCYFYGEKFFIIGGEGIILAV
jgi:hypothetical protein